MIGSVSNLLINKEIKDDNRRRIAILKTYGSNPGEKFVLTDHDDINIGIFEEPTLKLESVRETDTMVFLFPNCVRYIDDVIDYKNTVSASYKKGGAVPSDEKCQKNLNFSVQTLFDKLRQTIYSNNITKEVRDAQISNCFMGFLAEGACITLSPDAAKKVPSHVTEYTTEDEKQRILEKVSLKFSGSRLSRVSRIVDHYGYTDSSLQKFYGMNDCETVPRTNLFGLVYENIKEEKEEHVRNIFGYDDDDDGKANAMLGFLISQGLTNTSFLLAMNIDNFFTWSSNMNSKKDYLTQQDVINHVARVANNMDVADESTSKLRDIHSNVMYGLLCSSLAFMKLLTFMFIESYKHGGVLPQLPLFLEHYIIEYIESSATGAAAGAFMVDVITEYLFSPQMRKTVEMDGQKYVLPPYLEIWSSIKDFFSEVYFHVMFTEKATFLPRDAIVKFMLWVLKLEACFFGLVTDLIPENELMTTNLSRSQPFRIYAEQASNGIFVDDFVKSIGDLDTRIGSLSRYVDNQCWQMSGMIEHAHLPVQAGTAAAAASATSEKMDIVHDVTIEKKPAVPPKAAAGIDRQVKRFFYNLIHKQNEDDCDQSSYELDKFSGGVDDLQWVKFFVGTEVRTTQMLPSLLACVESIRRILAGTTTTTTMGVEFEKLFSDVTRAILSMLDACRQIMCRGHVLFDKVYVSASVAEDFTNISDKVIRFSSSSCMSLAGKSDFHVACRARTMQWIQLKSCRQIHFRKLNPSEFPDIGETSVVQSTRRRAVSTPVVDFYAFDSYGDAVSNSILSVDSKISRTHSLVMEQLATGATTPDGIKFLTDALYRGFVPCLFPVSDVGIAMQKVFNELVRVIAKDIPSKDIIILPCVITREETDDEESSHKCFLPASSFYTLKLRGKNLFSAHPLPEFSKLELLFDEVLGGSPKYNQMHSLSPEYVNSVVQNLGVFLPSVRTAFASAPVGSFGMDDIKKRIMLADPRELPIHVADFVSFLHLVVQLEAGGNKTIDEIFKEASFSTPNLYTPYYQQQGGGMKRVSLFSEHQHEVYLRELVPDVYNEVVKATYVPQSPKLTVDVNDSVRDLPVFTKHDTIIFLQESKESAIGCFEMAVSLVKMINEVRVKTPEEIADIFIEKTTITHAKVLSAANTVIKVIYNTISRVENFPTALSNSNFLKAVNCLKDNALFGIRFKENDGRTLMVPNIVFLACLLRTILSVKPYVSQEINILNVNRPLVPKI